MKCCPLLLIEQAVIKPGSVVGVEYLDGYDGQVHLGPLAWLIARLALGLYLLASALAGHDMARLAFWEIMLRFALFVAVVSGLVWLQVVGILLAVLLIGRQIMLSRADTRAPA